MVRGVHKIYLSAILDLYDRRIVSYIISDHNDNPIVFDTFKAAVKANPDAHPLFHSDRGFQYTNQTFHHMLEEAGMTQSMGQRAATVNHTFYQKILPARMRSRAGRFLLIRQINAEHKIHTAKPVRLLSFILSISM